MPSLIEQWFSVGEILAIWNRNPLKFVISGSLPVDGCEADPFPHQHTVVEAEVQMFGLPKNGTLEEAIIFFGWGLEKQIEVAYKTSDVPDNITWTGRVVIGLMNN